MQRTNNTTKMGSVLGLAAALMIGVLSAPAARAQSITGSWTVDPVHTDITFAIQHFGISMVRGRFDDVAGTIVADADHPDRSSVTFTIQAGSIDTGFAKRDEDLRGKNYFDVADYPTITFVSTRIEKRLSEVLIARGNLTIHGVTKMVSLPFRIKGPIKDAFGGTRIGVEINTRINRLDYGVGGKQMLDNGDMAIGDRVDIAIGLEAVPAK